MPTVRLADHLEPEYVVWDLPSLAKPKLLKALAGVVADRVAEVEQGTLLESLKEREATQSTGIGMGIALPHAALEGLSRTMLFVGRVEPAVHYDSLDGAPVDLIFLLLSPCESLRTHLRLLARLARLLGQTALPDKLRMTADPRVAYRLLVEEDARHVY